MLMRQPVSEPGEIWWVFLDGYKWLCPRRPNWFSNIKVMSTYIWLAWMQSWETCTQKWPVICGCNWTTQLEKSIPFFIPLFGMLENAFQPCCPSPSQLSSPRRHPARNKLHFLIWNLYQFLLLHLCVLENSGPRMDCQWALGHNPWGLPAPNLGPLHHQHVVGEGGPEPEALQHWLCLPLLHLLHLHSHLVAVGLRNTFKINCKHKTISPGKGLCWDIWNPSQRVASPWCDSHNYLSKVKRKYFSKALLDLLKTAIIFAAM